MRHHTNSRSRSNPSAWAACALLATGFLWLSPASSEAGAPHAERDARTEVVLQAAARSDYTKTREQTQRRDAFVLTANVRRASSDRPHTVGVVLEYSGVDGGPDTLLVGGMFTRKAAKWTAATSPFFKETLGTGSGQWYGWGGVRRQLSERHSLSVEVFASLETRRLSKWLLGYTGKVSESVSVNVAAGSGLSDGPDRVARGTVVWRLRGARR